MPYLGARTQVADTGGYTRDQADALFPSKDSVVAISSTGTNTTMVKPPVYGIRVLEFTSPTGTVTLPTMTAEDAGCRFRVMKNHPNQGAVNINLSGTNTGIWGSVQLKLNADGDFWEVMWTGSRFVLTDGHETGSGGNGRYCKMGNGRLTCSIYNVQGSIAISGNSSFMDYIWTLPAGFIDIEFHFSAVHETQSGVPSNKRGGGWEKAAQTNSQVTARYFGPAGVAFDSTDAFNATLFASGEWY